MFTGTSACFFLTTFGASTFGDSVFEKVEIKESKLFIDGKYHKKNLLDKNKNYSWALEQNQIIVLGDNYLNSFDSRKLGPINLSDIQITHIR